MVNGKCPIVNLSHTYDHVRPTIAFPTWVQYYQYVMYFVINHRIVLFIVTIKEER